MLTNNQIKTDKCYSNVSFHDHLTFNEADEGENIKPDITVLEQYSGHGLTDLNNAALMNRVDTKYLIPIAILPELLTEMQPYYSALEIEGTRQFSYQNLYFDTPERDFYYMHHQGKLSRFKVRHRHYLDTQTAFLEVKHKNNKGRTIKSRIPWESSSLNQQKALGFLDSCLGEICLKLQPAQWGAYQRIALASEQLGERLTLDLNVGFKTSDQQTGISFPDLFIAELKQGKYRLDSPFARLMKQKGIRPSKFSKYCVGSALLNPSLKSNRFKPQLITLQKKPFISLGLLINHK